jgi:MbtH protein
MSNRDQQGEALFEVVVNHEEQYSVWPADKPVPLGWRTVGKRGGRESCLAFIKETWVDMRPLSLRTQMESGAS